jgi:hypothetical protein
MVGASPSSARASTWSHRTSQPRRRRPTQPGPRHRTLVTRRRSGCPVVDPATGRTRGGGERWPHAPLADPLRTARRCPEGRAGRCRMSFGAWKARRTPRLAWSSQEWQPFRSPGRSLAPSGSSNPRTDQRPPHDPAARDRHSSAQCPPHACSPASGEVPRLSPEDADEDDGAASITTLEVFAVRDGPGGRAW